MRKFRVLFFFLTALLFTLPLTAQNDIRLTLAVPEWQFDSFNGSLFDDFEAEHGVEVVLTIQDEGFFGSLAFAEEPARALDNMAAFASNGDVLAIESLQVSTTTTRAGMLLDLAPLIQADSSLDVSDFTPAAWEAFQWDGGHWAIPLVASSEVIIYDVEAFDEAGLAYPDASWTLDDFSNAATVLTTYDDNGDIEVPGFLAFSNNNLLYSLIKQTLYDSGTIPNAPQFNQSALVELLTQWQALQDEGVIGGLDDIQRIDFDAIPLSIGEPRRLYSSDTNSGERNFAGALLPNGYGGMHLQGYAVSAGTLYPELSYELIKYMSTSPEIINRGFFRATPTRQSMIGLEPEGNQLFSDPDIPADVQALIDEAVANAITPADLRFYEYIFSALNLVETDGLTIEAALEQVQLEAEDDLQLAENYRQSQTIIVDTPEREPELASGETTLRFNLRLPLTPLPNREAWEALAEDFAANHPEVGRVELVTDFIDLDSNETLIDCTYSPFDNVQNYEVGELVYLNLDPLLDTDPNFDPEDFLPGVLDQVTLADRVWALPIIIEPGVLMYNMERFEEAGATRPEDGWTIDSFMDALNQLRSTVESDLPLLIPEWGDNNRSILMLAAAYGGVPVDYRTVPFTVNLTDPTSLDALQQVLDLARAGDIEYGGGTTVLDDTLIPMYSGYLNVLSNRVTMILQQDPLQREPSVFRLTTFPEGSEYTPVAYDVGSAYIMADTLHPEACYEWISQVAQNPQLFNAMPARYSLLDDPTVTTVQGDAITGVYDTIAAHMQAPNILIFPGRFGDAGLGIHRFIEMSWINEIFDAYVLEGNDDLEGMAAQVEADIAMHRECLEGVPEVTPDMEHEEAMSLERQRANCTIAIDPDARERFFSDLFEKDE